MRADFALAFLDAPMAGQEFTVLHAKDRWLAEAQRGEHRRHLLTGSRLRTGATSPDHAFGNNLPAIPGEVDNAHINAWVFPAVCMDRKKIFTAQVHHAGGLPHV